MRRVISLVPSSTETLLAMGANVVACSRFCEQPDLAHVGGTKNPDIDAIVSLAPDLVVLDREENRLEDHEALVAAGLVVFASDVVDLRSGVEVVAELAGRAGVDAPVVQLPTTIEPTGHTVFVPIWRRPWMTISNRTYGASLLRHLGVELIDIGSDDAYPVVELDHVASRSPSHVLVPSEPYEFGPDHIVELANACPRAQIIEIDGQDLFWWGVRTPEAITRLGRALSLRQTR